MATLRLYSFALMPAGRRILISSGRPLVNTAACGWARGVGTAAAIPSREGTANREKTVEVCARAAGLGTSTVGMEGMLKEERCLADSERGRGGGVSTSAANSSRQSAASFSGKRSWKRDSNEKSSSPAASETSYDRARGRVSLLS